jgi:hypothetical protein
MTGNGLSRKILQVRERLNDLSQKLFCAENELYSEIIVDEIF